MEPMDLQQLKQKSPADLLVFAEELEIEGASNFRTQDLMFAILKALAEDGVPIYGIGVLEVLQDGFGFLRSPESNYLPGRMTFMSPPIRCAALRCAPAIRSKAKFALPRMASVTLRW